MGRDRTRRAVGRAVALLLVLAAWLAVAGIGGPLVGRLSEVQRNDNASFLPELAESTQVLELAARFSDAQTLPYLVVVQREGGLTEGDAAAVRSFVDAVPDLRVDAGTAFIVAFGVLLDTLVVRSLLVPAVSYDIGRWVWWPSRLYRVPSGRLAR